MAVLSSPVVLSFIAASPIAVLKFPVVSLKSASVPMAVFPAKSGAAIQFCAPNRRLKTEGRVAVDPADGRVAFAYRIIKQCEGSIGCIGGAGCVGTESERSIGRVGVAGGIA